MCTKDQGRSNCSYCKSKRESDPDPVVEEKEQLPDTENKESHGEEGEKKTKGRTIRTINKNKTNWSNY